MKRATVGEIVHYLPHGQYKPLPAIVVDVSGNGLYCNLCVFGKYESYHIEANFSQEIEPGYWSWPVLGDE